MYFEGEIWEVQARAGELIDKSAVLAIFPNLRLLLADFEPGLPLVQEYMPVFARHSQPFVSTLSPVCHTTIFRRKIANVSSAIHWGWTRGYGLIEVLMSPPQIGLRGALFAMPPKQRGVSGQRLLKDSLLGGWFSPCRCWVYPSLNQSFLVKHRPRIVSVPVYAFDPFPG